MLQNNTPAFTKASVGEAKINFAFWGTGPLAESVLYNLSQNNFLPSLIITSPDKKVGRHFQIEKNILATWAEMKNIPCWQPTNVKDLDIKNSPLSLSPNNSKNSKNNFNLFIVASYPKILNPEILNIPKFGNLNVHPSLLPKYRGPSPIQTAILNGDEKTGVTILQLDAEIDHGPILIQKEVEITKQDNNVTLEKKCGLEGGQILSEILEHYINNNLKLIPQNHEQATFTRKFKTEDGEIKLEQAASVLHNKFQALLPHIPIYFSIQHQNKKMRVKITEIILTDNSAENKKELQKKAMQKAEEIILKVIPENKSEISWADFQRGYLQNKI